MDDLDIHNKSRAKLRTLVKNGNAIKICLWDIVLPDLGLTIEIDGFQ